jgi:hypothetical protein
MGTVLIVPLVAVLASSLRLLAALDTGALVMLSAADLSQNAGLGTAALETLERAVQRFIFLDMDFRHLFSLPPIYPALSRILFRAIFVA